jgi:hypothetical protein
MNKIFTVLVFICAASFAANAQSTTKQDTFFTRDINPVTHKENQLCKWIYITVEGKRKVIQKMFADFTINYEVNGVMKVRKTYDVINEKLIVKFIDY